MTEQAQHISDAIPATLDKIITLRRDIARLYLATEEQIADLERIIPDVPDDYLQGAVSDWRLITYEVNLPGRERTIHIHLLGDNHARGEGTKITSPLVGIDLGSGLVATHSGSIYRLVGDRGEREPTMHQLLQVCGALWYWGKGEALGVLHVFY